MPKFSFQEIEDEIRSISRIAEDFLDPYAIFTLQFLIDSLESIRSSAPGGVHNWGIPEKSPVRTIVSPGAYNPGAIGHPHVSAMISSTWEIRPIGNRGPRSRADRVFELAGQATTKVRILQELEDGREEIAMWRMEIGDRASPGCIFHVQVLGESPYPPFPHSLPIPRFPGLLVSPPAVLEFVLAELFQDEWRMHTARETPEIQRWRAIERRRLRNVLSWLHGRLDSATGSPWVTLKRAIPPDELFLHGA